MEAQQLVFSLPHTQLRGQSWSNDESDAPVLIALHGWLDNGASFLQCLPYIGGYRCLAIDLAGHGLSDHRGNGSFYHLWDYVQDVVYLIRQQQGPVVLLGHSLGGAVAILVAAILPESISKLIVLDSVGPLVEKATERVTSLVKAIKSMHVNAGRSVKGYDSMDAMIMARSQGFTSLSMEAAEHLVVRGSYQGSDGKWFWRHDSALKFPSPYKMDEESVREFMAKITCPTLMLFAEQGLFSSDDVRLQERVEQIPVVVTKWLPGNHHFHLEPITAPAVRAEIQRFIRQNNYE